MCHATWNLLFKRRRPGVAFFLMAQGASAAALLPAAAILGARAGLPAAGPPGLWPLVVATGACQAVYAAGLAGAYRRGDLSLAYPLARALPVVLVPVVRLALAPTAAAPLPWSFAGGAALVVLGCLVVPVQGPSPRGWLRSYVGGACAFAALAALGTTGYTVIDDHATRLLREAGALGPTEAAVLFVALLELSTVCWLALLTAVRADERRALSDLLRSSKAYAAATGFITTLSYGFAVGAMAYVADVSYIAAFRQLSIPLGVALGVVVLREPLTGAKAVGVGGIVAGLAALAA